MSLAPRWLLLALGVSVTLNLVGLGWLVGRSTAVPEPGPGTIRSFEFTIEDDGGARLVDPLEVVREPPAAASPPDAPAPVVAAELPRDVNRGLEWIVASLPPERRASIAVELDAREGPLLEETRKVFVIREEIRDELARSEFEKQRLEEALTRLREQLASIQADSHRALADVAAELSGAEREALAGRMASSGAERALIAREAAFATAVELAAMERRAEADSAALRVYSHRILLEHGDTEDPERPPE